jgi:hypothetical protein
MPTRTTPRIGRTPASTGRFARTPAASGGRFARTTTPTPRARPLTRTTTAKPRSRGKGSSKSQGGLKGMLGALPSIGAAASKAKPSGGSKGKSAIALLATGAAGILGRKQLQKRKSGGGEMQAEYPTTPPVTATPAVPEPTSAVAEPTPAPTPRIATTDGGGSPAA